MLEEGSVGCGRHVSEPEIWNAINNSVDCAPRRGQKRRSVAPRSPKWPSPDAVASAQACNDGFGLAALWELSPLRFDDAAPHTEDIIDVLFPGNPWLCVGASMSRFDTRHREDWRGSLHRMQLIVPNPMTDKTGTTKSGTISAHTLDNTAPRRFLVIEFDEGTFDEHAAVLRYLARFAPLVAAVMSGGKSLHGWFLVEGKNEHTQRKFMNRAVLLGADRATWTRSQFVRIPDGTRDNGVCQSIIFFNPNQLTT